MPRWRGALQTDLSKLKLFNLLSWTHENFKIGEYKENINFEKLEGDPNGGSPSNGAAKIQTF